MTSLNIRKNALKYKGMVGTGGIGSGMFFALNGDHTLGREESRSGRLIDRNDYCKLHIIAHYVQTLLGPDFTTVPIGSVGDDEPGTRLFKEMERTGMVMKHVKVIPGEQTLFSLCFIYPDESGGNLTVDDSASTKVDAATVAEAENECAQLGPEGIVLCAPEVPLEARAKLLDLATQYGMFRTASFVSEEMHSAVSKSMIENIDLLAVNIDEAAAAASIPIKDSTRDIVERSIEALRTMNPDMMISVTAGQEGSWSWDGTALHHMPVFKADVASTAGAGDCHFAGIIAGIAAGLTLFEAQELGNLAAALSVTSPHTINKDVNKENMKELAEKTGVKLSDSVFELLE